VRKRSLAHAPQQEAGREGRRVPRQEIRFPVGLSEVALHGSVVEFAHALLSGHVPPLSLEDVAALAYLHAADRVTSTPALGNRPPNPHALVAARVVAAACAPLLTKIGWIDGSMPPMTTHRPVVIAMAQWIKRPIPGDVFGLAARVSRETGAVKEWDAVRRRSFAAEVAGALIQIARLQRQAVRLGFLEPSDRTGVLTELLVGGLEAGPRTTRSVLSFDAEGRPRLDGWAVVRRIRRRTRRGGPPVGRRAPVSAADRSGDPRDHHATVEQCHDTARVIEVAARTDREHELLHAFMLCDTTADAARTLGLAPSTGRNFLARMRARL
jgi:hypothetical protein